MLPIKNILEVIDRAEANWFKAKRGMIEWTDAEGKPSFANATNICQEIATIVKGRGVIYTLALASLINQRYTAGKPNIALAIFILGDSFDQDIAKKCGSRLRAQLAGNRYADKFAHTWHTLMEPNPEKRDLVMQDVMRTALAQVLDPVLKWRLDCNWPLSKKIYTECVPQLMSHESFALAARQWATTRSQREAGKMLAELNKYRDKIPPELLELSRVFETDLLEVQKTGPKPLTVAPPIRTTTVPPATSKPSANTKSHTPAVQPQTPAKPVAAQNNGTKNSAAEKSTPPATGLNLTGLFGGQPPKGRLRGGI